MVGRRVVRRRSGSGDAVEGAREKRTAPQRYRDHQGGQRFRYPKIEPTPQLSNHCCKECVRSIDYHVRGHHG